MRMGSITTDIVSDGLVFNLDAANRACYPQTGTTVTDTTHNNIGTLSSTTFESTNNGVFNFDGVDDHITYPTDLDNINRPGVTNQITLAEKDTGNVLDEDFNENGFYIKSPVTDLDDALYISREKIENAKSSKINVRVGSSTSKFIGVYPQQSPLISRVVRENGTVIKDYRKFTPTLDNYFELGKSDKTKSTNSGTDESGFNYTGSRCNSFLWGMLGRNSDDTGELYTRKSNVYFRYGETLERGQELIENFGLTTGVNVGDFISFNYDVVTVGDSTLNPSSVTPNNSTIPGANYVKNRGDIGYIITNVPWNSENLK